MLAIQDTSTTELLEQSLAMKLHMDLTILVKNYQLTTVKYSPCLLKQHNTGRMYDKYGNLEKWWPDETIEKFNERAQCYVDQYNNFYVPELDNKTHVGNSL